jgi:hypothetical protein
MYMHTHIISTHKHSLCRTCVKDDLGKHSEEQETADTYMTSNGQIIKMYSFNPRLK